MKSVSWKRIWMGVLGLVIVLRLLYALLGISVLSAGEPTPLAQGPIYNQARTLLHNDDLSNKLINVWLRWDTGWYMKIASNGYSPSDGSIAFMPVYPILMRLGNAITNIGVLPSGLLIATLSTFFAFVLLAKIAWQEFGEESVAATVLFLAFFPTGFFLLAAYTESLFLVLTLSVWLLARSRHWWAAGIVAALATLTRPQGVLLSIPLFILFAFSNDPTPVNWKKVITVLRTPAKRARWKMQFFRWDFLAALLPVLTLPGYYGFLRWARLGSPSAALESHWGIRTVMPWTGFWLFFQRLLTQPRVFVDWIDLSLLLVALLALILGFRRLHPALSLYSWALILVLFMRGTPPHLLDSFSRYLLIIFPIFLLFSRIKPRWLQVLVWCASFSLQIFLLLGFLDWRWIA